MQALAIAGLVAGLAGIAGATLGRVQAAESEAEAANRAARFSELEARSAEDVAAAEEATERRSSARILARQRAIGAASGVDISTGSPLLIQLDSAKEAELDALNIRHRGQLQALGKREESVLSKFKASLARKKKPGIILGGIAAGGSVLAGPGGFGSGSILSELIS